MQHRYPFTLLYLDIDSHKVDVNVHPRKLEVRLSDQERLYHELCLAIQNALMNRERIPEVSPDKEARPRSDKDVRLPVLNGDAPEPFERSEFRREAEEERRSALSRDAEAQERRNSLNNTAAAEHQAESTDTSEEVHPAEDRKTAEEIHPVGSRMTSGEVHSAESGQKAAYEDVPVLSFDTVREETLSETMDKTPETGTVPDASESTDAAGHVSQEKAVRPEMHTEQMNMFRDDRVLSEQARRQFRLIGQLFETYWLIEYRDSLYIIDQHAAHEKVNYERMMRGYREKKISSQMLYPPVILNLSAHEADLISRHMDSFTSLGFELEPFGLNTYRLNAVPANLYVKPEDLFTEVLGQLDSMGEGDPAVITEKIASMACKASVKGNMQISEKEAEALIDELLTLENPYNCPHGRPTIISISRYEMDKKFRRIVS